VKGMSENPFSSFQEQVDELLIRHRSFLDVTSKFQESGTRINRSLTKAVTECGCIRIDAQKQPYPTDAPREEWRKHFETHLSGRLCEQCLETVQTEIGKNLFYLTALCNLLEISLPEVMEKESKKLTTLGVFNLR
jgi:NTP pyrophosphatase (non-canonical NTP hydrolase)